MKNAATVVSKKYLSGYLTVYQYGKDSVPAQRDMITIFLELQITYH